MKSKLSRKILYVVIILLMSIGTARAQDQTSVINFPEYRFSGPADTNTVKRLLALADSLQQTDVEGSLRLSIAAYKKSKELNFKRLIFVSLTRIGTLYQAIGRPQVALDYLMAAAPYTNLPETKSYINIYYNEIAVSYSAIGKYENALKYYYKALEAIRNVKVTNGTDSVGLLNNVGILWARMEEMNYALQNFKMAEVIATRNKDTAQLPMTYLNIAESYYHLKKIDSAELFYLKTLKLTEGRNMPRPASTAIAGLAGVFKERKEYEKALAYLNKAMSVSEEQHLSAYALLLLRAAVGDVYLAMGDYKRSRPILTEALAEAEKMNHEELIETLEPKVAEVYAALGDYQPAYRHLNHYLEIKDSLYRREKARSLEVWMNARMAEKNKAMLAQKLYITRQDSKLQQQNFLIGGTVLGALLLLSVSFAVVRNYKHKQAIQQAEIQKLEQTREITQLKARVRGEEQERQRIARELHDNIAGQLWAIKLNVDNLKNADDDNPDYDKSLNNIFNQLTDAAKDLRKTAHNLMPDLLLEEGLAAALASLCEKTGNNTKLDVSFQEYGSLPRMDKEIELSIYRMVQELIQNVMKHAKDATQLLVQLSCANDMLNITVEDNGSAQNISFEEGGMGLQQIRKRTQALRGHFDLQTVPGKGTTAYLEFDLQQLQ